VSTQSGSRKRGPLSFFRSDGDTESGRHLVEQGGQTGQAPASGGDAARAERRRGTLRRVRLADRTAASAITIGGLGVIVAVLGMLVFLAAEVVPLFSSGQATERLAGRVELGGEPLFGLTDEYLGLATLVMKTGEAVTVELAGGAVVAR
jgi:hypothetical protein